jgi:carbon-monoxide dehydrogenase large subunit
MNLGERGPGEIGRSRRPIEDERLVLGRGQYVSDFRLDRTAFLAFARSPYPHARITEIDISRAAAAPGVLAVLTAADLPTRPPVVAVGVLATVPPWLARDVVHTVGEPIVAIIAESESLAADAVALIDLTFEPLPAVTDPEVARTEGVALVHPEFATNLAFTLRRGSGDVDGAFARADVIVRKRVSIPRLAGVPMEPLGVLADWNAADGSLTVWCTTQAPWRVHAVLAETLGLGPDKVRVVAPDVGGGFGVRGAVYGEYIVTAWASRHLGQPVRYVATRSEDFLVTHGSRETNAEMELAATRDGHFLGLRVRGSINLGAYAGSPGGAQRIVTLLTGAYAIPAASVELVGVYTNTVWTGAYRGAGRPEAAFLIEAVVEELARELAIDPIELRRRNLIPPTAFPYRNALGLTYDTGDYAVALDRALALVGYANLVAERDARRAAHAPELLGIGIACYIEPTGGGWESGRVRVEPDGKITAISGSVAQGQDHATTFGQIVADRLGVRFEDVTLRQGDTADGLPGVGTFGSRSTFLGGGSLTVVADEVYLKGRRIAAHLLEAAPEDVVARDGRFTVVGVAAGDRSVSWAEVAAAARSGALPADIPTKLDARTRFDPGSEAMAAGTCVAVVSIDPSTGTLRLRRLALVHDCGTAINPLLVDAQVHGGLAQGAGEALGEWLRFDENGQLLTGSLMDYWLPHSDDLPSFEHASAAAPTHLNPLGVKGVGEAGTVAAPPAILAAAIDALRPLGVTELELPLTPPRIWSAIQAASRALATSRHGVLLQEP